MAVSEPFPTASTGTSGEPSQPEADRKSSVSRSRVGHRETWSLRRQLIVPLAATILMIAVAVSVITRWAVRDAQTRWATEKLDAVDAQLQRATYPLTQRVIEQIKNYSGVEAILIPRQGAIISTFSEEDLARWESLLVQSSQDRGTWFDGDQRFLFARFGGSRVLQDEIWKEWILSVRPPPSSGMGFAPVWGPIASGLVSVLAMILVTTMIGSRIVRRIESLESQVDRIASGNFDIVQPQGPEDAIRRLSVSINSMSSQLAKAQEWIARTERSRLISMIAGGMAHQLRNALTGASLLVQSFIRSHPGERMEELAMAENQLKLASEAVRRLLASDPSIELVDEPDMSIKAISSAARDCVSAYAAHQQVDLVWDIDRIPGELLVPQGASVLGGLVNLLMNAIEAVDRHGKVVCESILLPSDSASAPIVLWRVIDNGPGPDPHLADSMMEPFVTSKREGVGLGLAMAARIAQRCHGSLSWRRQNGSTIFELMIPGIAKIG